MVGANPYEQRRVKVVGTSRAELNGSSGFADSYDRDKGRYNVNLDNGQVVALKPANLEPLAEDDDNTSRGRAKPSARSSTSSGTIGEQATNPWVMGGIGLLVVAWLYQFFSSSGGGGGSSLWVDGDSTEYDDRDEGYLSGQAREVTTLDEFRGALMQHSENTGLPVVANFFSQSCGPCRMIAPTFKRLAKEYKGRVVFLRIDVNRNYETSSVCNVRGMPTFQFFQNKKKVKEFSGADDRGLQQSVAAVAAKAEEAGIYVGQEVTAAALREFYQKHDESKVAEIETLAQKYAQKTALLMRVNRQKYNDVPKVSVRQTGKDKSETTNRTTTEIGSKVFALNANTSLTERSVEELRAESARISAELQRRGSSGDQGENDEDEIKFLSVEDAASEGVHKVVIIGGGPSGLAAAIYAARAGLKPLIVAPAFGGQLLGKGVDVENYPGIVGEHATGKGVVELMRNQALSFDARMVDAAVLGVTLGERPFRIKVNGSSVELLSRTIILAIGAESRWLRVDGEQDFKGRGVSACATCDGFYFRNRDVVVVGGGDHAMEDALHLARSSKSVTLVHRRDSFRASVILQDRVLKHSNIRVRWNTTVETFHGKEDLTHVAVQNVATKKKENLQAAGVFVAIGHDPPTGFLRGQVNLDDDGYVALSKPGSTFTSVPGFFAAGDVADKTYRQAITASGSGAMAALDVEHFLNEDL